MKQNEKQYYLGNKNLPRPDLEIEWTPQMVRELKKARQNILYFAENFFHIVNLDRGKEKIKLFRCQKRVLRSLRDNRFNVLLSSRQAGKALSLDTKIPTPRGFVNMGDIQDGDQVIGLDGKPYNVVKAHDAMHGRDCYEVEFDNGQVIVADGEHLWFTQSRGDRCAGSPGSVKTTVEICSTLTAGKSHLEPNHRIPTCIQGVEYTEKKLPIDPYVLGIWLGDGCYDNSTITVGKRDISDLIDILKTSQTQFTKFLLHEYAKDVYSLRLTVSENRNSNSLHSILKANNLLHNKHIPDEYMMGSRDQRLALLQGLLDSDGYIDKKGAAQFYNCNIDLANQVQRLIESLGYKTTYVTRIPKLYGAECRECARVSFMPIEPVCRLSFKRSRLKYREMVNNSKLRHQWHYVKDIRQIESVPVRCITVDSPDSLYLCGEKYIPTHNTTLFTIYCLWIACFQEDQNILIVANKEQTAISIFRRVRLAYENLPPHLKPGVLEYGKTSMALGNGSHIGISTTSSDAGRGSSVNCLILDELAFIDNHLVTEFWRSVFPIISSSKKSKILIASTPNGTDNLFHQLYEGAEKGESNWKSERIDWWEIPGRDDAWKEDTIKALGSVEAFSQEFGNCFLDSGESAVNNELYDTLKEECRDPEFVFDDGSYLLWEEPDPEKLYVAGVDVAEGVGENASVIQIFDFTDLTNITQVAVYSNNNIPPYNFTTKLEEILKNWGNPLVAIERNNCGAQVVDNLYNNSGYTNLVHFSPNPNKSTAYANRLGVVAHTNTKYKGVMNMRYWVNEMKAVKFRDIKTINELKDFVRYPNGTWAAKKLAGCLDDRVMSLIWCLIVLENSVTEKYFEVAEYDDNSKPLRILPFDYGIPKEMLNPLSMYNNEKAGTDNTAPIVFSDCSDQPSEISDLQSQGWSFIDDNYLK